MKHIKYVARLLGDDKVEVLLLQQTHTRDDLYDRSIDRKYGGRMFKIGDYALYGHSDYDFIAAYLHYFEGGTTLFLLPQKPTTLVDKGPTMTCTLEQYQKFKELAIEYNKWGETQ